MQFNLAQLLQEPPGAQRSFTLAERVAAVEVGEPFQVAGSVRFMRTDKGVWASGSLSARVALACGRCLKVLDSVITIELDEEFVSTIDIATGLPVALETAEPDVFRLDEHHVLDLREAIRQYTLAASPMKPLCRPDCRGLCPGCGTDWNERECHCSRERSDPRWDALREFLASSSPQGGPRQDSRT